MGAGLHKSLCSAPPILSPATRQIDQLQPCIARLQTGLLASGMAALEAVCCSVAALSAAAPNTRELTVYKSIFISIWCESTYVLRNNFILEVYKVHNTRIYLIKTLICLIIRLMFLLKLKNKYNDPSQKWAFILIRIE